MIDCFIKKIRLSLPLPIIFKMASAFSFLLIKNKERNYTTPIEKDWKSLLISCYCYKSLYVSLLRLPQGWHSSQPKEEHGIRRSLNKSFKKKTHRYCKFTIKKKKPHKNTSTTTNKKLLKKTKPKPRSCSHPKNNLKTKTNPVNWYTTWAEK